MIDRDTLIESIRAFIGTTLLTLALISGTQMFETLKLWQSLLLGIPCLYLGIVLLWRIAK
jgi:hypothetical protein